MGEITLVYGKSGSGKSRSLMNFGEDEIFFVNTIGKRLPFAKKFKYELKTDNVGVIMDKLAKMPTKVAVIDDAGYQMTNAFMRGHGKGDQFKLYNDIADSQFTLYQFIRNQLPDDVFVYILMHEDANDQGETRLRTIGKLLNEKVCLEGMVTVCLRCVTKNGEHLFLTNSDGSDICKSPEGLFPPEIPNDLKAVYEAQKEFWGIKPEKKADGAK